MFWLVLTLVLDQITKYIATLYLRGQIKILSGFFIFTYATNTGVAFGLLSGVKEIVIYLTLLIVVVMSIIPTFIEMKKSTQIFFAFILGGALGNLIDRIRFGYVVDFITMIHWPTVFNIADMSIMFGSIGLVIQMLIAESKTKRMEKAAIGGKIVDIQVTNRENGWRLDKFVLEKTPDWISRTYIQKAIKNGEVLVNGISKKPSHKVKSGDTITLEMPDKPTLPQIEPENIPLDIIYEDRDILVHKQTAGHNHTSDTIAHLRHDRQRRALSLYRPRWHRWRTQTRHRPQTRQRHKRSHGHRQKRPCTPIAHQTIQRQTHGKDIHLLSQRCSRKKEGNIEINIVRNPILRVRMTTTASQIGKPAMTNYRVVRQFDDIASLVLAYPKTGRTHQIRVHMKYIGHPLMGDEVYGRAKEDIIFGINRQMLHALSLSFYHPRTNERVKFIARIPADFKQAIQSIDAFIAQKQKL